MTNLHAVGGRSLNVSRIQHHDIVNTRPRMACWSRPFPGDDTVDAAVPAAERDIEVVGVDPIHI
jgi:hypothetical protein